MKLIVLLFGHYSTSCSFFILCTIDAIRLIPPPSPSFFLRKRRRKKNSFLIYQSLLSWEGKQAGKKKCHAPCMWRFIFPRSLFTFLHMYICTCTPYIPAFYSALNSWRGKRAPLPFPLFLSFPSWPSSKGR